MTPQARVLFTNRVKSTFCSKNRSVLFPSLFSNKRANVQTKRSEPRQMMPAMLVRDLFYSNRVPLHSCDYDDGCCRTSCLFSTSVCGSKPHVPFAAPQSFKHPLPRQTNKPKRTQTVGRSCSRQTTQPLSSLSLRSLEAPRSVQPSAL
jgi:hypothetical protein